MTANLDFKFAPKHNNKWFYGAELRRFPNYGEITQQNKVAFRHPTSKLGRE
jgi:hypothetical protein